jgi:PAS domain S-box-containing protein
MITGKILLADNQGSLAESIRNQLESFGFTVSDIVSTMDNAIQLIENNEYDLLLVDDNTADIKSAEQIRKQYNIPVLYLTDSRNSAAAGDIIQSEFLDFVRKPLELPFLKLAVDNVLYKSGMAKRLKESEQKFQQLHMNVKEKEEKYQLFVQNIQGIAYSSNMNFIPIFFEGDVEEMTGYKPEDFLQGRPRWDEVIYPEDLEKLFNEDEKKLHENSEYKYEREYRIIRKDKSVRWVRDSIQNVCDENGKPFLVQGLIQDITERKNVGAQIQIQRDLGISLSSIYDLRGALFLILSAAMRVDGIDSGGIYLRDPNGNLNLEYTIGLSDEFIKAVSHYDAQSEKVKLIMKQEPLYLDFEKLYKVAEAKAAYPYVIKEKLRFLAVIPILFMDEVIGCLNVASHVVGSIPRYSKNTLESIASLIGSVVMRLRVEEKVRKSLNEKEILLKEVHHRVKNNMQIISSLLNIKSDDFENEKDKEIIDECQNRIRTISLVYEKLYQSEDFSCIDLEDYLIDFVSIIKNAYTVSDSRIDIIIKAKDIYLSLDRAITIIQILNEFFSNSLKYAFPEKRSGEIIIEFTCNDGTYTMMYSDNGVGLPEGIDMRKTESFGLKLAYELIRNVNGTFKYDSSDGLKYCITFKG